MTQKESIRHWKQGAQDAIEAAELLQRNGKHALALFNCHLAAEKILKAQYIAEKDAAPPKTHNLLSIALELSRPWPEDEKEQLRELTTFAFKARYEDVEWDGRDEALQNADWWIRIVRTLITHYDHEEG